MQWTKQEQNNGVKLKKFRYPNEMLTLGLVYLDGDAYWGDESHICVWRYVEQYLLRILRVSLPVPVPESVQNRPSQYKERDLSKCDVGTQQLQFSASSLSCAYAKHPYLATELRFSLVSRVR